MPLRGGLDETNVRSNLRTVTKGEDTRGAVLGQALALASQLGLEGVTIGKLAEHVGMSKSGLFAHFASKENLQVAILDEAVARFVALVVAPALKKPRGEARLRALLDRWLAWAKADFMPGGCVFAASFAELDDRPGPARDRLFAAQRDWLGTLAGAVRIAVEEKQFRRELDPEQVAHELYANVFGLYVLARLGEPALAERRTRAAFERILLDARVPS